MSRHVLLLLTAVAFAVAIAACGGDGGSNEGEIVFGSGEIPQTMPDDFPLPQGLVIGSTLIDGKNGVTEVTYNIPANRSSVQLFYEQNFPIAGYTVVSSEPVEPRYVVTFEKDELSGTVTIQEGIEGVSTVTVRVIGT